MSRHANKTPSKCFKKQLDADKNEHEPAYLLRPARKFIARKFPHLHGGKRQKEGRCGDDEGAKRHAERKRARRLLRHEGNADGERVDRSCDGLRGERGKTQPLPPHKEALFGTAGGR